MLTIEARRQALEELRTADRILAGVLGTLRFVVRQQRRDMFGFEGSEGFFGEATIADVDSAIGQLAEAQQSFRRAVGMLGGDEGDWVELERWGYTEVVIDGITDVLGVFLATRNVEAAEQVHTKIRGLFASVRASDPTLQEVPLLEEWEDEGTVGEVKSMWAFNKPAVIGSALFALMLMGIFVFLLLK